MLSHTFDLSGADLFVISKDEIARAEVKTEMEKKLYPI